MWPWRKKQFEHRDPDDFDVQDYLRGLPSKHSKKVWLSTVGGDVLGPVDAMFFKNGKILVKPYADWKEVYPDGTGSSYIKAWWSDELREP